MAYTREQFGKELKHFVSNKEDIELIGSLAYRICLVTLPYNSPGKR